MSDEDYVYVDVHKIANTIIYMKLGKRVLSVVYLSTVAPFTNMV